MAFKASPLPKTVTSSVTVFQWLNNLSCQHHIHFYFIISLRTLPGRAMPPKIFPKPQQIIQNISVWVRCFPSMKVTGAVSARSVWWWGHVWNLSPPAKRPFPTGGWSSKHQIANVDQTLASTDGHFRMDLTLDTSDKLHLNVDFLFYSDIPDLHLSVTGSFAWLRLSGGPAILINDPLLRSKSLIHINLTPY